MRLFFITALSFLITGCGLLQQSRESAYMQNLRKENRDPYHVNSCGPEALQKALNKLNVNASEESISYLILSRNGCDSLVRDVLSIFHNGARKITFPDEIMRVLKKNGYKIKKTKDLKSLSETKDVALVLIKKRWSLNYHWMCFPVDKNILSFFGNDTLLLKVYLITK